MWVIDFEASGLRKKSYPIEVGITDSTEHYSSLIRPLPHWKHWEEQAKKVHNISLDEIIKNGKDSLICGKRSKSSTQKINSIL